MSQSSRDIFVGRKAEFRAALQAIKNGKHVFVHGPYGIGKSTFGRALLDSVGGPRLAVSLNESPSDMADQMIRVLSSYKPHGLPKWSMASAIYFYDRRSRIKSFRTLKKIMEPLCNYRLPILVDDFRKVTTTKIAFINMLSSMRFRIILAMDSGFDKKNAESLMKSCPIHTWIELGRMSNPESEELLQTAFQKVGSNPRPEQIRYWVEVYGGSPLQLMDCVRRNLPKDGKAN